MSNFVVGFDIGSSTSYVVIGRDNGIESVANGEGDRNTPTFVSFTEKTRFVGSEAKQQQITNINNTVNNFIKLLGKTFNDPTVQREIPEAPYKIIAIPNNRVGIEVSFLNEKQVFTPEQLLAIHLRKLKDTAEMNLSETVKDVVINLPTYSTPSERQAIYEAAKIVNLNVISLVNDNTASALAYGIYLNDLPSEKVVAFIDMGYSHLQSSIVRFANNAMTVLASCSESVGGRDFDNVIYRKMKKDILKSYKLRVVDSTKSGIRLRQECEKLKRLMSANSTEIPLNIDCFMNDIDISGKMSRAEFEELSSEILLKVRNSLKFLMRKLKVTIDTVEIVGGSSRVPAVKQIITEVVGRDIRTSLNADESVARGCALYAVVLGHGDKVHRYRVTDCSVANGQSPHCLLQHSPETIAKFCDKEKKMQLQVELEKEKMMMKNSVEEFIYAMREKVVEEVQESDNKNDVLAAFEAAEDWLYGDGEDVSKDEYEQKLIILKKLTDNIF